MSSSSSDNSHQQLTISVLNRVFDFAAVDAKDAILRLGLVSQQWNDCLNYCPSMWERLTKDQWPSSIEEYRNRPSAPRPLLASANDGQQSKLFSHTNTNRSRPNMKRRDADAGVGVGRASYQTFKMRMISMMPRNIGNEDFGLIRGCNEDASEQFQFLCPVIAQNLHTLQNEVHPQNGLPIMFCDICQKKVHPVTNDLEIEEAASLGRCVSIEQGPAITWKFAESDFPDDIGHEVLNIAIVVSKQPTLHQAGTKNVSNDLVANVLRACNRYFGVMREDAPPEFLRKIKHTTPLLSTEQNEREGYHSKLLRNVHNLSATYRHSVSNHVTSELTSRYLSRNALNIAFPYPFPGDDEPSLPRGLIVKKVRVDLRFRVVEVDSAPPATTPASSSKDDTNSSGTATTKIQHPCNGGDHDDNGGALSNNQMPSNGGWSYMVCVDSGSSRWFTDKMLYDQIATGSAVKALCESGRVKLVQDPKKKKKPLNQNNNNENNNTGESLPERRDRDNNDDDDSDSSCSDDREAEDDQKPFPHLYERPSPSVDGAVCDLLRALTGHIRQSTEKRTMKKGKIKRR